MAAFLGLFIITSGFQVDTENADKLVKEFSQMVDGLDGDGIFAHNVFLALLMFIPGFGAVWGMISASATGYAFASLLQLNPNLPFTSLEIFFTTFGILELVAYSIAISRSALLVKTLVKKSNLKKTALYTAVEICIMIAILYIAGHIEYGIIEKI